MTLIFRLNNAIVFGAHDKYTGDGTVARPQKIIVHPHYVEKNDTNDIALIKVRVSEILFFTLFK